MLRRDRAGHPVVERAVSPWPFVGMSGMAGAFFLYAASGLIVPAWAAVLLMVVWLVAFVQACLWWSTRPVALAVLPAVLVVGWFVVVVLGAAVTAG